MNAARSQPAPRTAAEFNFAVVFAALLALFVFRVCAQLLQLYAPVDWLPPFQAWHSGTLPYGVLVAAQIAIIVVAIWMIKLMTEGRLRRQGRAGGVVSWIGLIYLVGSAIRFVAGFTIARETPFLNDHLPGFFHIVLALMVVVAGRYLKGEALAPAWLGRGARSAIRYAAYPLLMVGALAFLAALLHGGAALAWAPYATVAIIGPMILLCERIAPFRKEWAASMGDYVQDGVFMVIVQVIVPFALGWAVASSLASLLQTHGGGLDLWPDHWPIAAQLVLKVIAGDFLRYWLHRAAHTWRPLWRLHEVHHAQQKLYSTSVFRFHPFEKTLQFCCDTLPFIIIGIGPEALAYYFVFYAISGLFQHSNVDIRLGPLNYIFSGPEVHRWHHSRTIAESNNNYAHSFVVWDLAFGTYFRPKQRKVETLGLLDPAYPSGFARQMAAPFRPDEGKDS
jgi:sterol desaturase/sphingolipid hydroxylase (fatty acid hydroxylase superfamily)